MIRCLICYLFAGLFSVIVAAAESLKTDYRYCVVGAGPGGLQFGHYLNRANVDYILLEKGPRVATFFRKFPRQRGLIS